MQYDVFKFTGKKPVSVKNRCYIHIKNLKKNLPTLVSSLNDTYFLHQHLSDNVMFVNIMSLYVYKKWTNLVVRAWPVPYAKILTKYRKRKDLNKNKTINIIIYRKVSHVCFKPFDQSLIFNIHVYLIILLIEWWKWAKYYASTTMNRSKSKEKTC